MLTVTIDASKLTKWAGDLSARGMRNAIRRAVDKSATAARKIALENISKDIGVPKARIKNAVSKVRRTTLTNLSASFTASKMRISILPTGASVTRPGGLTGSTFRLTGGCSASLNVKEAFIVNANGGRFVAVRRSKSRLPIKASMQRCRARPSDRAALGASRVAESRQQRIGDAATPRGSEATASRRAAVHRTRRQRRLTFTNTGAERVDTPAPD